MGRPARSPLGVVAALAHAPTDASSDDRGTLRRCEPSREVLAAGHLVAFYRSIGRAGNLLRLLSPVPVTSRRDR
jgi:hypothetical protein